MSGLGGQIKSRSESAKSTPSFQVVTEFPFQPIDLIEWVQLRVRALNNKVLIGENGNAFTQYEMELSQRFETTDNKSQIRITRLSGDPES